MNLTNWDADNWEITVAGEMFFVSAVFNWEKDSVDYQFNPSRGYAGQGRDLMAEVACDVLALEIFADDDSKAIELSKVAAIRKAILDTFRESEYGTRSPAWQKWA